MIEKQKKISCVAALACVLVSNVFADPDELVQIQQAVKDKEAIMVADQRYWWEEEGNLCARIGAKFNSAEQEGETLDLRKEIGTFRGRKWILKDVLVSADFNANGDDATWTVSGPKPLLEPYIKDLEARYKDRSLFYDFGYELLNCLPTAAIESE